MKHIVRKAYWDYEKEEKWLNEMSAKGLALTDYSWCRYVFTEAPKNEYIYRIELLDNLPNHPESSSYIKFLEENGVECVATYMRWLYLRKKSSEGAFDIYSDIESRIKHYRRIFFFYSTFMWAEFMAGLANIAAGIIHLYSGNEPGNVRFSNFIIGSLLVILGTLFLRLSMPIRKKIGKLRQENIIRE